MIDEIMAAYQKIRHGIMGAISGTEGIVYRETSFYDQGYMQTRLEHIKRDIKGVDDQLRSSIENDSGSEEVKAYRNSLMKQRTMLVFQMIFTMSNSLANLDNCLKLADGYDFGFTECVLALKEYKEGSREKAFSLLKDYYRNNGRVEDHYLVNKVFGILLSEDGQYEKAIPFLAYASGFVPDDEELIKTLTLCYKNTSKAGELQVMSEISEMLGMGEVL